MKKDKDKDHHPNNFFSLWENSKKTPLKETLIIHLKKYDQERNIKGIYYERSQFTPDIERKFKVEEINKGYWKGIETVLEDPNYLGKISIVEAFQFFLKIAKDNISYFKKYNEKSFEVNQKNKNELFALYQMTLLFIVGELHSNKKFRENAKIKDNEISKKVNLFAYLRLKYRLSKRFGAFARFDKEGLTSEEARMKVNTLYPVINDDYLCERDLIKLDKSWLVLVILIFVAWYFNN